MVGGLKAELNVAQPRILQGAQTRFGQSYARGDQVGVIAHAVGFGDQRFEVLAQGGLAAGEADLHRTHGAGLSHHVDPLGCAELVPTVIGEVAWITAEHALQRALICQLQQQPDRVAAAIKP